MDYAITETRDNRYFMLVQYFSHFILNAFKSVYIIYKQMRELLPQNAQNAYAKPTN